ncbi:SDR family NAD(P)-dependent oxidoreductase [Gordonia sp. NPDC003424]
MAGVENRVVIVTGAGGGLGKEYAKLLASQGAKVVVNDLGGARDGSGGGSDMADSVVAEIKEAGGEAVANYESVATAEGAVSIVRTAVETFGAVHGVVSNAGILRDTSFAKMTDDQWDAVLQVHLYGGYNITHAAWPYFREQSFGRIVVATSTSGLYGNFGQANYGAAKLGLVGLVNTLAIEGARSGITANAVAPLAATRMTEDIAPAEFLATLPPAYVAPVVNHLMSEQCTDTGSVFIVRGGSVQRVQQFANEGVRFAEPPTPEDVTAYWSEITDMSAAVPGKNPLG